MTKEGRTEHWPKAHGFTLRDQELVQSLWNDARTARLSDLYYGSRLAVFTKWNFAIELLIAITTSGSGIAGWAVWQDKIGAAVWAWIAAWAAIFAIAKPLLAMERRIRGAASQQQIYRTLLSNLENLAFDIQQSGELSQEHRRQYQLYRETLRQADGADDLYPSLSRRTALQAQVEGEMPADSLWVPSPNLEPHPA